MKFLFFALSEEQDGRKNKLSESFFMKGGLFDSVNGSGSTSLFQADLCPCA